MTAKVPRLRLIQIIVLRPKDSTGFGMRYWSNSHRFVDPFAAKSRYRLAPIAVTTSYNRYQRQIFLPFAQDDSASGASE